MRWPIRNQILLPLITIQLAVAIGVTWLGAWTSLRRVEQEVQSRFQELTTTIQRSTFPLTSAVLEQLRGLSGAEFVIQDERGTVQATTLKRVTASELQQAFTGITQKTTSPTVPLRIHGVAYLSVRVPVQHQGTDVNVVILYPDSLVQSARRDAIQVPIRLGWLTLALTTIAVIVVAQHIGKRIQAIERQVARVAQGNFQPIPLPHRRDELRDLSASVNGMSVQLDRMTRQIRETERAQLIKQLAGGIAHQLRNSLTGARLALQLHRRRCERSQDESLDVALHQLALTEEQIRGLVALIRDEHRPRVPGRLQTLADEISALIQPMCEHRQIRFFLSGDAGELWLPDADQIRAALLNLCINAIEASTAGGRVDVRLTKTGESVVIDVYDDGPGIPAEAVPHIFDPFQSSKADGMGLGLALVKQTAEDHAGSIYYLREAGRTLFRLTCCGLPRTPLQQQPVPGPTFMPPDEKIVKKL